MIECTVLSTLQDIGAQHNEPMQLICQGIACLQSDPDQQNAHGFVDQFGWTSVEPGAFEIRVGPSSRDRDLLKTTLLVK